MRLYSTIFTLCALAAAAPAAAQSARVSSTPFESFQNARPSLQLSNPSFLSSLDTSGIYSARLSAAKGDGWIIPLSGSPDLLTGSAQTSSFVRLSDRMVLQGKLSYEYSRGKDMGAQILMDPDFNPVNFLESTDETRGIKNTETYNVLGRMAYKLSDRLDAGLGFNYVSADQTKIKDPRFSNVWMDLSATAGLSARIGKKLTLGADFTFRQTLEQVKGGIFGTTDKQYFYATDKGGFFGTSTELAGDYTYISVSSFRPMSNTFYKASLQLTVADRFFNELSISLRDGYYGKKSSSSPVFYEFGGIGADYKTTLLLGSRSSTLHKISAAAGLATLSNTENVFKYVSPVGEDTRVEYTGANEILSRTDINISLDYLLTSGDAAAQGVSKPSLEAGARLSALSHSKKTTLYPYYRNSSFQNITAQAFAFKSVVAGKGILTFGGSALLFGGTGVAKEDGSYTTSTGSSLKSYDDYLFQQFEYDTLPRLQAGLEAVYTRHITHNISGYISISEAYRKLLAEPEHLRGTYRNCAAITVGCTF